MFDDIDYKATEKRKKSYRLVEVEKGYSGRLSTLGKVACFSWYLDGVEITDEDIKLVVPLENATETISFAEGYERAKTMVDWGFDKNAYNKFLEEGINPNQKEAVEKVLNVAYSRSQNNFRGNR